MEERARRKKGINWKDRKRKKGVKGKKGEKGRKWRTSESTMHKCIFFHWLYWFH
jgi:hypothetical protein